MCVILCFYTVLIATINVVEGTSSNLLPPGYDTENMNQADIEERTFGSKLILVVENCQMLVIWGTKACLLIMYLRFTTFRKENTAIKAVAAYVAISYVVMEVLYLGYWCRPFHNYWYVAITTNLLRLCANGTTQGRPNARSSMRHRHQPSDHKRCLQHLLRCHHARPGRTDVRPHSAPSVQESPSRRHLLARDLRHPGCGFEQILLLHRPLRQRLGVLVRPRKRHSHHRRQPPVRLAAVPQNIRHPKHQRDRKQEQKQERKSLRYLSPL